jgi:hypothetical protein
MKWLTKEQVREAATTPERALDISIEHHQQNVDATEKQLAGQDPLAEALCGLCWYYNQKNNGGCKACPLGKSGVDCFVSSSLYQEALQSCQDGNHKAFIKAETALLDRLKQIKANLYSGDKSMDKKQKLQKTVKDLQKALDKAQSELAEAEVTYSIGDRFKRCESKYIMIHVDCGKVNLINLGDGGRWTDPRQVEDRHSITAKEFDVICSSGKGEFRRYWNRQKGKRE